MHFYQIEIEGVFSAFDFKQSLVFFQLKLPAIMGIVKQLLVELILGQFLGSLDEFLLLDLFVQVLFL